MDRVIDAYIAELRRSLRGPRRARIELLTEARDSLVDATESYESRGLRRGEAERRAVGEFGDVRLIAADFQAELGVAQTRRTALLVLLVIGAQASITDVAWRVVGNLGWTWRPTRAYVVLAHTVDRVGYITIAVAAATLILCHAGARWQRIGRGLERHVARVAGVVALTIGGFFVAGATVLTVFSPLAGSVGSTAPGLALLATWCATPAVIALSARRCLQAA